MNNRKKHAALVIALIMAFTVIPAFTMADTASAATALAKPTLTNHAASSTSIKNTWTKVKNAKGYEVYRATSSKGKYKKVKTVKSGKTVAWTNKSLKKNKKYYYKVRAYKYVSGKKKYSKFSAAKWAKPTNSPNPVFSMSATAKKTSKVYVKITNKGRYTMYVNQGEFAMFFKNMAAVEATENLTPEQYEDVAYLNSKGIYPARGTKVTIKPGKTGTVYVYPAKDFDMTPVSVSYSSASFVYGEFNFNKKPHEFFASKKYGSEWE